MCPVRRAVGGASSSSIEVVLEVGERGLAERGCVQRQHRSDLEDLQAGIRAEDVVNDERSVAVEHGDADRLLGAKGQ